MFKNGTRVRFFLSRPYARGEPPLKRAATQEGAVHVPFKRELLSAPALPPSTTFSHLTSFPPCAKLAKQAVRICRGEKRRVTAGVSSSSSSSSSPPLLPFWGSWLAFAATTVLPEVEVPAELGRNLQEPGASSSSSLKPSSSLLALASRSGLF